MTSVITNFLYRILYPRETIVCCIFSFSLVCFHSECVLKQVWLSTHRKTCGSGPKWTHLNFLKPFSSVINLMSQTVFLSSFIQTKTHNNRNATFVYWISKNKCYCVQMFTSIRHLHCLNEHLFDPLFGTRNTVQYLYV